MMKYLSMMHIKHFIAGNIHENMQMYVWKIVHE